MKNKTASAAYSATPEMVPIPPGEIVVNVCAAYGATYHVGIYAPSAIGVIAAVPYDDESKEIDR